MKKLLLILLSFMLSILLLISLYHSLTNISLQVAVEPLELPKLDEQGCTQRLSAALKIPVLSQAQDSLAKRSPLAMQDYLGSRFTKLFQHPNVQVNWLEDGHWVLKWQGRDERLKPWLILGHYDVKDPPLEQVPKWTYNPFVGKIAEGYSWGAGALSGKSAKLASLEALQAALQSEQIPDRSLYLAFVTDAKAQQPKGWQLLAEQFSSLQFETILLQKSNVYEQLCLDFEQVAMIGCAPKQVLELELRSKDILTLTDKVKLLVSRQPAMQWRGCATEQLLNTLTPELSFFNKWIMSNRAWLGGWLADRLKSDAVLGDMLGSTLRIEQLEQPAKGQAVARLCWELSPDFPVDQLKQDMQTLFELDELEWQWLSPKASWCSSPKAYGYEMLQTTCQQVLGEGLVFPGIADCSELGYFTALSEQLYAFHPLCLDAAAWNRQQADFDERIKHENYYRTIQFYRQLYRNVLY